MFRKKISRNETVRTEKGFPLSISNEVMNEIIKIVKLLENPSLLTDVVAETVKHEMKKQKGGFLGVMMAPMAALLIAPMVSSLIQPVASSVMNAITSPLKIKVLGKVTSHKGRKWILEHRSYG